MFRWSALLFIAGLGVMIVAAYMDVDGFVTVLGDGINAAAPQQTGAANFVTSVVLGYRGFDTLLELTILFSSALVAALVLGPRPKKPKPDPDAGLILQAGVELLFPLLLVVGLYIILHGHLTPGGGFQGGVVLATAFFVPLLARPGLRLSANNIALIEGSAGVAFILIGLLAMAQGLDFLTPLFAKGEIGSLLSAGSLPLLYLAVGLKVGSELAGLLAHMAESEAVDR